MKLPGSDRLAPALGSASGVPDNDSAAAGHTVFPRARSAGVAGFPLMVKGFKGKKTEWRRFR
jgi:hypothetical protein